MAGGFIARFLARGIVGKLTERLSRWQSQLYILYLAIRHKQTPLLPKIIGVIVFGYVLSPIDLFSDFIPLLGFVDDIILAPLGAMLALKLVPEEILADCHRQATIYPLSKRLKKWAAIAVVSLILLVIVNYFFWRFVFA